jgi:hypothetical protein
VKAAKIGEVEKEIGRLKLKEEGNLYVIVGDA